MEIKGPPWQSVLTSDFSFLGADGEGHACLSWPVRIQGFAPLFGVQDYCRCQATERVLEGRKPHGRGAMGPVHARWPQRGGRRPGAQEGVRHRSSEQKPRPCSLHRAFNGGICRHFVTVIIHWGATAASLLTLESAYNTVTAAEGTPDAVGRG